MGAKKHKVRRHVLNVMQWLNECSKSYDSDDSFDDLDDPPGFWEEASQLSAVWEDSFSVPGASRSAPLYVC